MTQKTLKSGTKGIGKSNLGGTRLLFLYLVEIC